MSRYLQAAFAHGNVKLFDYKEDDLSECENSLQLPNRCCLRTPGASIYGVSPMSTLSLNLGADRYIRRNLAFIGNDSTPLKYAHIGKKRYF